jgi:hypothetical protein
MKESYSFKKKNSIQEKYNVPTRMRVGVQSLKKAIIKV